jgi:predicted RNA binding protein YcfA (HicA-like mRNA interferase family)
MSKIKKLISQLLLLPVTADVDDVIKIYLYFGWTLRAGGKHSNILVSPDQKRTRAVPTISGRHVKSHYIKTMIEDLSLREYLEGEA